MSELVVVGLLSCPCLLPGPGLTAAYYGCSRYCRPPLLVTQGTGVFKRVVSFSSNTFIFHLYVLHHLLHLSVRKLRRKQAKVDQNKEYFHC